MQREPSTTAGCYAHTHPGFPRDPHHWQPLNRHLAAVAQRAADFATAFDSSDWAWNAGWLHDLGKVADEFQRYLLRENGLDDAGYDDGAAGRINHSSAGAALAEEWFGPKVGRVLAYLAAGHHAGLPDWFESDTGRASLRCRLEEGRKNRDRIRGQIEPIASNLRKLERLPSFVKQDQFAMWVRLLFSCLTDADCLDTEAFMDSDRAALRTPYPVLTALKPLLDAHLADLAARCEATPVNLARREVLDACRTAAYLPPGVFSLTVPTGGGKTLSGLTFALDHAVRHGKRRIVYAIPYTSIIEQTGNTFADVFGRENVVEHHSNLVADNETPRAKLAADNWDAPLIITTNVQLFESLYSARPGRCRKLHNLVNSVIVLDEAQMLPAELLTPCVDALNQLVRHYDVTLLISTATQPALPGLDKPHEIVPDPPGLYARLKRTRYRLPVSRVPVAWDELSACLGRHERVLCVVNSRKDCYDLFRAMPEGTLHLSALMCGEHRSRVIAEIKRRLADKVPTRVISTQLVEAGVDLDFPVVYRAWAGLDSIAQAGGRCNREGRLDRLGEVHVFEPPKSSAPGLLRKGEDAARELIGLPGFDIEAPSAFAMYFRQFYGRVNDTGKSVLAELTPDSENLAVAFRSVGERFKLIDDSAQCSVFVRYDKGDVLLARLAKDGPNRDVLRRLQRYSVSLHRWQFERMRRAMAEIRPGYWAWNGRYDPEYGLGAFETNPSPEKRMT